MISLPLMKQSIKSNGILLGVFTIIMGVLLVQFASMEMTQFLLFLIQYGMMAMILPSIYILISSNKLLAGQVDKGSMAYVLSTPKKRSTVVLTQLCFSAVSVILMFAVSTVLHCLVNKIVPLTLGQAGITDQSLMANDLTSAMIIKINISAMLVCLAVSGICFMFSGIFNQSKYSIGFSGAFVGVSILANMMAMFGSLGIDALEKFKYLSLCTLYDYNSVLADTNDWIIKSAVALGIAVIAYIIGSVRFCKKDLPL